MAMLAACVQSAHAQVGVQLPNLPRVELPAAVGDTVNGALGQANAELGRVQGLADLRQLRIRALLRTQRQFVERDPNGAPILRAELVGFSPDDGALERARSTGFSISRERALEGLDARVVVLRAPEGMSTRRALARLRAMDPDGAYDYNHVYLDSGVVDDVRAGEAGRGDSRRLAGPAEPLSSESHEGSSLQLKLGLVDGGVDAAHPVFRDTAIHQHGCGEKPVPSAHGTAVASLMIGRTESFHGAAPGAELFAADVYCGLGVGGAVDAVVDGIAWIARQRVAVINVSLVGPRNVTLENVVKIAVARGFVIVAAVGNDGAASPPLYPAAYPGVIGVTGVDRRQKVLVEACRGPQVDFAAPGSDMAAAMLSPSFAAVRGTSFAAPIVAGLLAAQLAEPSPAGAAKAVLQLAQQARDLGARGVDKVYGQGLVGDDVRTVPAVALLAPSSLAAP
jgi:hypothetical protein